jgi:hypothetical protein
MKTVFWLLAMVLVGLLAYWLHGFIELRKGQVEFYNYEVGSEMIARYALQADSLRQRADSLRMRLDRAGLLRRRVVQYHLDLVEDEIAALDRTIEMWRKSRRIRSEVDLYRQTVLLYGEASAAARALAGDTLFEGER